MWEIKGKDNQTKATVYALEYNGEWMGESYVSVTIESPSPIAFAIGDYLMYRGERFEINYDPGKIKSAPQFTKGDAFKYENVKFNSLADELTRCDFLDVVLGDNQLHFTGLPKFSFYGGVQDLANRIQANLNRAYPNQWAVVVSPEYSSTKELNVSVDTQKVWDALSILVNDFETYFTIKGRTITIGAAGVPAGHLFKYGKGNGLYEIEQNAEADQAIVTRLRAYGSTRNLPHRYYNSLTGADGQKLIPDNMAVQYLMLPSFPYTTQDPYIDSANKAALGIREGTVFFDGSQEGLEEIYPSIEDMTAEQLKAAGVPCNSTGALDVLVSAEQMTDDGVGDINEGETETTATPPTFKVTLKDLGFDINDYRTTEAATLSFKTGMLGGRDFEIVGCEAIKDSTDKVTGYELELNRVYDDGIKLWFPYKDYNAKAGDKVVILHIAMPEVYIKAAAQRLLEATTAWLAKNDYSRSVYAPKVDEIFMARQHDEAVASGGTIASLHDTLKEGILLLFEDEDLNIDASIFIDRLSIKEGDGPVPTYEVVLKEEKTVGRLDKMQNQIDSLASGKGQGSGGYNASQIRSLIDAYGSTRFLSKLKDDTAKGKIASDIGFEIGKYLAGVSGGMFGIDKETGDSFAEVAKLFVRGKAYFETLTLIEANTLAGKQYITPGGSIKCAKVEEVKNEAGAVTAYRCYFLSEQDGEKTETKIVAGDQVISEIFNAKTGTANKVSNHRYWRLVTAVNNDAHTDESGNHYGYIDLSKTDCEIGSDIPKEGDIIDQFGNRTDATRQSAMVFSTVDSDSPSIKMYSGIGSGTTNTEHYSLNGKAIISFGREATTGKVYFRLGADGATQYLDYRQDSGLEIKGRLSVGSTLGGETFEDWLLKHGYIDNAEFEAFVTQYTATINDLKAQNDRKAETWYQGTDPSTVARPNGWLGEAASEHKGDLWYCTADIAGTDYKKDTTWHWNGSSWEQQNVPKSVFDAIDGKADIFVSKPTEGYKENDLWFLEAEYTLSGVKYPQGTLVVAIRDMVTTWSADDWVKKDRYTDDTLANEAINQIAGYEYLKNALQPENPTQIVGGLIMSTLISLGYSDSTGRHTMAGMNGSWVDTLAGRTIGSWWGGSMVDLFDKNDNPINPTPANAATSLIRMDGTGYFVDGLFRIKKTGLEIGDTANGYGISMGMDGRLIMGNGISINIGGSAQGLAASIESVTTLANKLSNLFTPYLGNTPKTWAEVSIPGTHFDSVRVNVGLWTDEFLSCLGKSDMGGSGGGGGGLVESIYRWADLGGTFSDTDNDTFNAYTVNRIYSELTAADSAISARLANFYTKSEADGRYALKNTLANYVTLNTEQTITARKNFSNALRFINTAPASVNQGKAIGISWHTTSDTAYADTTLHIGSMTGTDADGNISSRYLYLGWGTLPWAHANNLTIGNDIFRYKGNDILHSNNYAAMLDQRYLLKSAYTAADVLAKIKTVDGVASGLDADLLDGYHKTDIYGAKEVTDLNDVISDGGIKTNVFTYASSPSIANKPLDIVDARGTVCFGMFYALQLSWNYKGENLFMRAKAGNTGAWQPWHRLAYTTDNVASADKLSDATAYTAWGQTFFQNGKPKSVSGNMTGVGTITASGATISGLLAAQGGVQIGATADYGWYLNSSRLVAGNGTARGVNVGSLLVSNAWADADKVPANGIYVKGALRIGDITIEEDKVNGGLHVSGGGLYADTFISALGVNPNDGSGTGGGGGMSYDRLDAWADYSADKAGYVLSALLGNDLYQNKLGKTEAQSLYQPIGSYVTLNTAQTVSGSKTFSNGFKSHYGGGSWISMATRTTQILGDSDNTTSNAHSLFMLKNSSGSAVAYGGLGVSIGFYGFTKARIDANTNGTDWSTVWNVNDGTLTHSAAFVANTIKKTGGTSAQFLKADGSVDSTNYLSSANYTASDVLNKLKTVDGTGSGLDADLLDGYHETVFVRDRDLGGRGDYQHVVFLLWKDSEIANHHIQGKLFTMGGGSFRYQAAAIDIWFSRWSATGYDWKGRFDTWGLGTMMRLVTCTYNGEKWWAVEHTNTHAINLYFTGTARNVAWTKVHYYTSNTSTVVNSEIYSSREAVDVGTYTVNGIKNALVSDTVANASALGGISASEYLTKSNYAATLDGRYYTETEINTKLTDGSVTKVGTATVGSTTRPVYLNAGVPTACSYIFGNASGNAALNNGTVNTNLNADLLDGVHLSGLFRKDSINGDADSLAVSGVYMTYAGISNTPNNTNGNQLLHFNWDANAANQLYLRYNSDRVYARRKIGGVWQNWKTFAFLDDNVASATKLQTARTLWGRSFDGTANVSGDMTGVGSITATGSISLSASSVLQFKEAGYGDKFGIWGDFNGFDDENRMYIGSATGAAGTDPALSAKLTMLLASGYIGLGTGSPTHRLHVNGYVRANGLTLDGSHLLEWDAANEAWKFNGNLYATGSLSTLGVTELSATEAKVESLKAKSIILSTAADGNVSAGMLYAGTVMWMLNRSGVILIGDNAQSGSRICMSNRTVFGNATTGSYYIEPTGDAVLKSLIVRTSITAASVAIKTAAFTVEGTEIYVTFGETKYKLLKTAVS